MYKKIVRLLKIYIGLSFLVFYKFQNILSNI